MRFGFSAWGSCVHRHRAHVAVMASPQVLMVGTEEQIGPDSEVVKSIRFAMRYTAGKVVYSTVLLGGPNAEGLSDFFGFKHESEEVQVCTQCSSPITLMAWSPH